MPKVSVVTPVYNGAQFIADNIRSVAAQTYRDWEHIIVDDCSTDDTCDVIRRFPHIKLIQLEKNGGPARALNHGYREATGDYFAWVSADDGYLPSYMEKAVAYLDSHPEAVCVDAGVYFVDVEGNILTAHHGERKTLRANDLLRCSPVHGSSTLFRREVYEKLGGFNEELIGTPDTDMWVRMLGLGEIGHVPEPVTYCTRHPNQDSRLRTHLVVSNLEELIDRTIAQFGKEALIPSDWTGPREGKAVEAAGWMALARAYAGTAFNPLVPKCIARARALEPDNPLYRWAEKRLAKGGILKFKMRARVVPTAVRVKSAMAKRARRNVHALIRESGVAAPVQEAVSA
jgi:glycosyltransferase involved in cell wall biosynthesis